MTINEDRLNEFVGRFAGDLGAVLHASTVARWATGSGCTSRWATADR